MQSVYQYTHGHELTPRSRKPARRSLKAWYLNQLHWQFFIIASSIYFALIYELEAKFKAFSLQFLISLLVLCLVARIFLTPSFYVLKGYISHPWRLSLSLIFSLTIVAAISSIWILHLGSENPHSVVANVSPKPKPTPLEENPTPIEHAKPVITPPVAAPVPRVPDQLTRPTPSAKSSTAYTSSKQPLFSIIEFQLVPYARVYDVSAGSPKFLIETHCKALRMESGRRVFRLDYENKSYKVPIVLKASERHVLFFDMHTGRYQLR